MSQNINKKVDDMLGGWKTPFQVKEDSWQSISQRIKFDTAEESKIFAIPRFARVAAVLAVILGLAWMFYPSSEIILAQTSTGETTEVHLPDGSTAMLNAVSEIRFSGNGFEDTRVLHLKGEAFFQVKEGSQFTVRTDNGEVKVLGTEFNVHSRDRRFIVQCRSGKVAVSRGDANVLLTKGMMVQDRSEGLSQVISNVPAALWLEGQFVFDERPVSEVFSEIERQFGVNIQTSHEVTGLFSGEFEKADLNSALDVVCSTMGLRYKLEEVEGMLLVSIN